MSSDTDSRSDAFITHLAAALYPTEPDQVRPMAIRVLSGLMMVARLSADVPAFRDALDTVLEDKSATVKAIILLRSHPSHGITDQLGDFDRNVTCVVDKRHTLIPGPMSFTGLECLLMLPRESDSLRLDDLRPMLAELRSGAWTAQRCARALTYLLRREHGRAKFGTWTPPGLLIDLLIDLLDLSERKLMLPGEAMALALADMPTGVASIDCSVEATDTGFLLVRLYYLLGHQGTVRVVDPDALSTAPQGDACLFIPAFGGRWSDNVLGYQPHPLMRARSGPGVLKSEGVELRRIAHRDIPAVVCVPAGLLFQGGDPTRLRKELVDTSRLRTVIELPSNVFPGAGIASAIVVLGPPRDTSREVTLIDVAPMLRGGWHPDRWVRARQAIVAALDQTGVQDAELPPTVIVVTPGELKAADYILTSARHRSSPLLEWLNERRTVPLDSLVTITRPPAVSKTADDLSERTIDYTEAVLADFDEADRLDTDGGRRHSTGTDDRERIDRMALRPNDILLASRSDVGMAALVPDTVGLRHIPGQTMVRLRLKEDVQGINAPVLLRYLRSPSVLAHLRARAGGSAVKALKADDIRNLPVPLFSESERKTLSAHDDGIVEASKAVEEYRQKMNDLRDRSLQAIGNGSQRS